MGIKRCDWRYTMKNPSIIKKDRVAWIAQRELSERYSTRIGDMRHTARDILTIDEHDEGTIYAIAMSTFRRRTAYRIGARLDAELMQFDMPALAEDFCRGNAGKNSRKPVD